MTAAGPSLLYVHLRSIILGPLGGLGGSLNEHFAHSLHGLLQGPIVLQIRNRVLLVRAHLYKDKIMRNNEFSLLSLRFERLSWIFFLANKLINVLL